MSGGNPNITVVVVVSGQPTSVRVNPNQKVEHLVNEALRELGNAGQQDSEWELRRSDGALIDQSQKIADAGIADGVTLFLSPRAGAGGAGSWDSH